MKSCSTVDQLVGWKPIMLINCWLACWPWHVDQLLIHMLIPSASNSNSTCWSAVAQFVGSTFNNVDQQLINMLNLAFQLVSQQLTNMSNFQCQLVDQQLINMLDLVEQEEENSTCWSTITQHVDFGVRVDQLLINLLTSDWCVGAKVDQLLVNMLIAEESNMLTNN